MAFSKGVVIKYESYPHEHSSKRPAIRIKFDESSKQSFLCLLDSGADTSIFPLSIGKKLGIDFSECDPVENPPEQMIGKIKAKCYKKAVGIYGPWGKETISLEILWIDSNEVYQVLGRKGFFDKFKEVIFCEEKKKIILRI